MMKKEPKKLSNFRKNLISNPFSLIPILLVFSLFPILYTLSPISAQERTITLDIFVTNPSDEEVQETDVKVDLPEELTKEDIVSSDGLEVGFDAKKGSLFVAGKVMLQPAETTIYKIEVRDVWVIPENEVRKLKEEVSKYQSVRVSELPDTLIPDTLILKLDRILTRQRESAGDISAHIAAFRENKKELGAVRSALDALRQEQERAMQDARRSTQNTILIGILAVFFGIVAYISVKKKEVLVYVRNKLRTLGIGDRRRYVRVPNQAEVEHRLLREGETASPIPARNISGGGISLALNRSYSPQSVLELKIKLPPYAEPLTFRGFVVWQKKVARAGRKEYYLTGISFGEVEKKEDYEKLKTFIAGKGTRLSKLVKRSSK